MVQDSSTLSSRHTQDPYSNPAPEGNSSRENNIRPLPYTHHPPQFHKPKRHHHELVLYVEEGPLVVRTTLLPTQKIASAN
jgi:hypothetical protein